MLMKIGKLILTISMCLGLLWCIPTDASAAEVASGTCGDNLTWILDDAGLLSILGDGEMTNYYDYSDSAPWLSYRSSIKEVFIENGVASIGNYAFFECTSLTTVTIPDSVTTIGEMAFMWCPSLESVTIPEKTTIIGTQAFFGCSSITSITIPENVTNLGIHTFEECTSLTSVVILGSITDIGEAAFYGCTSLSSITIPSSVTSVGDAAFGQCTSLCDVHFDGSEADKTKIAISTAENAALTNATWHYNGVAVDSVYTSALSTLTTSPSKGDSVTVNVSVSHESDSSFNAGELVVTYDPAKLTFDKDASSLGTATVSDSNGTLKIEDYGADKTTGNAVYSLAFNTIDSGSANITLTSAAFIHKENAAASDLISATISLATVSLTIQPKTYAVTLPSGFSGAETVQEGGSYTFSITDKNHTYSNIAATVNGSAVSVTDNGDGSYTVSNVTGNLTITATATPKAYSVTFSGNAAEDITGAATTATYGTDYSFTIPSAEGWAYKLESVTIGGTAYSGYTSSETTYTIPGTAITGNIVITVTKEETQFDITIDGASGDVNYDNSVQKGEDVTITVTPEAGYSYTVTATVDGKEVEVIDNGDNTYTVKNVTGDLKFTIQKTVISDGVTVTSYLTIDGSKIWLVKNAITVADGKVPSYNGEPMFWSEEYKAYCYLVIADTLDADTAKSSIGILGGTAVTVDYGMDVNKTSKVDASDAQLVYNIYNAQYSEFTTDVTMEKLLRADVNKSGTVTVEDAAAIISSILANT